MIYFNSNNNYNGGTMFLEKRKVGNNIYLMLVKNNVYFKNDVKKAKKDLVASFGNIANYDNDEPNFFYEKIY